MTFETGRLALQAQGAVLVTYDDMSVLGTGMMSKGARGGCDFFPLVVDFEMKYYASGKIKGSRFMKREGRASDQAILCARMIDRPIRPMFPKNTRNEVQIICTLLQTDGERSPAMVGLNASSIACQLAGMPLDDAIGAVRVGMKEDGSLYVDPSYDEADNGRLDLLVAGTEDAITMVESGSDLLTNEEMIKALEFAHAEVKKICKAQKEFVGKFEIEKKELVLAETNPLAEELVAKNISEADFASITGTTKKEVKGHMHVLEEKLLAACAEKIENDEVSKKDLMYFFEKGFDKVMRAKVFAKQERLDGRKPDEVRPIHVEVGLFPRVHGSALFQRGETQALTMATVGGPSDEMIVDNAEQGEFRSRYMHHYNFPPYSVGEIRMMRGPGRREIGHGTLAERALERMIPTKEEDDFPYTLRLVSEILTCNGSSSMAAVCGSTLSLMDAGIKIKRPISGIAMGLLMNSADDYHILTDIQAAEDFGGDMDFKVTGDDKGITALQLDIKVKGLKIELLAEALEKAQTGRTFILNEMLEVIEAPREDMNDFAPRVDAFKINPDYIRVVIGKGGETIQGLTAKYGVEISIEDDGLVMITAVDQAAGKAARADIEAMTYEPSLGDEFEGTVKNIMDFGAFVEYLPGKEALVHISEIAEERVEQVSDYLKEGQVIKVKYLGADKMGRVKLTMKGLDQ